MTKTATTATKFQSADLKHLRRVTACLKKVYFAAPHKHFYVFHYKLITSALEEIQEIDNPMSKELWVAYICFLKVLLHNISCTLKLDPWSWVPRRVVVQPMLLWGVTVPLKKHDKNTQKMLVFRTSVTVPLKKHDKNTQKMLVFRTSLQIDLPIVCVRFYIIH